MVFVFDLDDTVCKTDEFSEEYILRFFKENDLPYKKVADCTRFAEQKFDWDRETAQNWYKTYGDEMMLNFPCKENSVEIINKLYDDGHKIVIATARAEDWHTEPEKITKQWLENNKIKYHKLYIGRCDKEVICKDENANFFIDDDLNIISRFENQPNLNVKVLLASTKYNNTLDIPTNITRLNSFEELLKLI